MILPPPKPLKPIDREALFRYQVISLVLCHEMMGSVRPDAVNHAVSANYEDLNGVRRTVSQRSVYRWLKAYEQQGMEGLASKRNKLAGSSKVLKETLLAYLSKQKQEDPDASIPELIKRAHCQGFIDRPDEMDRTTVWRALKRMMRARLSSFLGQLFYSLGDYPAAEEQLQIALDLQAKYPEAFSDIDTSLEKDRMGRTLMMQSGKLDPAETYLLKASKERLNAHGPTSLLYLETQTALGSLYLKQGRYRDAVTLLNQTWNILLIGVGPRLLQRGSLE